MLIKRGTLLDGTVTDIRVGARIEELGDGLTPRKGEGVLYAGGGTVLPGLHDHHVHVRSAASALDSFSVGPPGVSTKEQLAQILSNATPGPDGWIRAVGYHESVAGDLDRAALDVVVPNVPVRILCVDELPRNAVMKVRLDAVRALYATTSSPVN